MTELTNNIPHQIRSSLDKAFEKGSREVFDAIKTFVETILAESNQYGSLIHFTQYIIFPASFYGISFEKSRTNVGLTYIHKHATEQALGILKNICWFHLGSTYQRAKSLEEKREVNKFYYWAFNGFSRLLYLTVKNKDYYHFDKALDKIDLLNPAQDNVYKLQSERIMLEFENSEPNRRRLEDIDKAILEERKSETYRLHILLGIKYWIIYLHNMDQYSSEETNKFINRIKIHSIAPKELFKSLLYFRDTDAHWYFEWHSWDYQERKEWQVYSPPSPQEWLTMGFLTDQIRQNTLYLNPAEFSSGELKQVQFFYEDLKKYAAFLEKNFDKWKKILKVDSVQDLRDKTQNLLSLFAIVKRKNVEEKERQIAKAPLSSPKIEEFVEAVGEAWKKEATIHNLFKHYKNCEDVTETDIKLYRIGQRVFFEKAKMMFIDGEFYSPIYGINRIGGDIGRREDDAFFSTVFKQSDVVAVESSEVVEIISRSLELLATKDNKATIIFLSPEFSFKDQNLLNDERFVPAWHLTEEFPFPVMGTFSTIPICSSFSNILENHVLVSNFEAAFWMKYKTNDNWFEKEMTIEVQEVDEAYAKERLIQEPAKWKVSEEDLNLTDEEAITLIRTSVFINTWVTVDFEIKSKNAFIIGKLTGDHK